MDKKFVLTVSYGTGEVSMLTSTPDFITAIQQFSDKMRVTFGADKGSRMPDIISAKITPVLYEHQGE